MEAEFIVNLCRQYRCLPREGGLLDQPLWFLRAQLMLSEVGTGLVPFDDDPLAGFPMTVGI